MPTINVTPNDFVDIVSCFLIDNMIGDELLIDNEEWDIIISKMEKCGLKSYLMHMYMNMPSKTRTKYKYIDNIFHTDDIGRYTINILRQSKSEKKLPLKKKNGIIKQVIKKSLKMIKSHKKRYGNVITEETVDKIIDRALKNENI
jgi:hypothetical protein